MKALILSVGNEVLSGKTINTNASFIAIELEKIGVDVIKVVTIGDNKEMLISEINSFKTSNIDIFLSTFYAIFRQNFTIFSKKRHKNTINLI